jgi:hypothetical protein
MGRIKQQGVSLERFRAKAPKKDWPILEANIPWDKRRKLIIQSILKDSDELLFPHRDARQFFEDQAPRAGKELRADFIIQISDVPSMDPSDFVEELSNYYGDDNVRGRDRVIDIKRLTAILESLEVKLDTKITVFHLVKMAAHLGLIDFDVFLQAVNLFKDILSFWDGTYLAYVARGLSDFEPPFEILKPQERDDLEDLLRQEPKLILKNTASHYTPGTIKRFALSRPVVRKGKAKETLLNLLTDYPGTYSDNRLAWDLYKRIMGDQGPLDKVRNPGFVHFLVLLAERVNQKEKYTLATDFLKLYLGIDGLNVNTVKHHLQPR